MLARAGGTMDRATLLKNMHVDVGTFRKIIQTLHVCNMIEEEFISAIERRDTEILHRDYELARQKTLLDEQKSQIDEQKSQIDEQKSQLKKSIQMLRAANLSAEAIASNLGMAIDEVLASLR